MTQIRTFGVPKKREIKTDPYEGQSVLIIMPIPENKGETYKFQLSKQALIDLDLVKKDADDEKLVSFSFDDNQIIIANTTSLKGKIDSNFQYNVSMNGVFSNKQAHDYIINHLEKDGASEIVLDVLMMEDAIPMAQCMELRIQNNSIDDVNKEIQVILTNSDVTEAQEPELETAEEIKEFVNNSTDSIEIETF